MVKLFTFAILAFLMLQLISAHPISKREVKENDDVQKGLENAISEVQKLLEKTFSKDQMEKFGNDLKDFGEKFSAKGKELLEQAEADIKKMQAKE